MKIREAEEREEEVEEGGAARVARSARTGEAKQTDIHIKIKTIQSSHRFSSRGAAVGSQRAEHHSDTCCGY